MEPSSMPPPDPPAGSFASLSAGEASGVDSGADEPSHQRLIVHGPSLLAEAVQNYREGRLESSRESGTVQRVGELVSCRAANDGEVPRLSLDKPTPVPVDHRAVARFHLENNAAACDEVLYALALGISRFLLPGDPLVQGSPVWTVVFIRMWHRLFADPVLRSRLRDRREGGWVTRADLERPSPRFRDGVSDRLHTLLYWAFEHARYFDRRAVFVEAIGQSKESPQAIRFTECGLEILRRLRRADPSGQRARHLLAHASLMEQRRIEARQRNPTPKTVKPEVSYTEIPKLPYTASG